MRGFLICIMAVVLSGFGFASLALAGTPYVGFIPTKVPKVPQDFLH